jgi:hypothetical protein
LKGRAPARVSLAGPDEVMIRSGDRFALTAEGDPEAVAALRFKLDAETLAIGRTSDAPARGTAVVRLTMPAPSKFALSGSGKVVSDRARGDVEVAISGSARLITARVDASRMRVAVSGSGQFSAAGRADRLELAGSGTAKIALAGLEVRDAKVSVDGAASAAIRASGEVVGDLTGSAHLAVLGAARCRIEHKGGAALECPVRPAVGASPQAR